MAAATEELATSVSEISEAMAKSRSATDTAFEQTKVADSFT
jgi:methyl-accepting chemotaxis protein